MVGATTILFTRICIFIMDLRITGALAWVGAIRHITHLTGDTTHIIPIATVGIVPIIIPAIIPITEATIHTVITIIITIRGIIRMVIAEGTTTVITIQLTGQFTQEVAGTENITIAACPTGQHMATAVV
jgi:hypothetical protein